MIPTMTCGQTSAPKVAHFLLSNSSSKIEFQVLIGITEDLVFGVECLTDALNRENCSNIHNDSS